MPGLPLVTVAIPLCRSRPFLDIITGNLATLTAPNQEILISDRHGDDDTIAVLAERYAGDPRIRFLSATDRVDWVAHYNALLHAARGKYFCWMPHDDVYPPGYVESLVAALEKRPDAVLAFGAMELENLGRPPLPYEFEPPPVTDSEPWSPRIAMRLLLFWGLGFAFRGVFRRDVVIEHAVFIEGSRDSSSADVYWLFGLALRGRFLYAAGTSCRKRFHPGGVSASWRAGLRELRDEWLMPARHLHRAPVSRRDKAAALVALTAVTAARAGWRMLCAVWPGRRPLPPAWLRRALHGVLRGSVG